MAPWSNIAIDTVQKVPSFRKIAVGAWSAPSSPNIYLKLNIDLERCSYYKNKALFLPKLTHAISTALHTHPSLNRSLLKGRFITRKDAHVFITVKMGKGSDDYDLSGIQIENPYTLSLDTIAKHIKQKSWALKKGKDPDIQRVQRLMAKVPMWLAKPFITLSTWLGYSLNLNLSWMGAPRDKFGSVIITPLDAYGIEECFVPLFPFSRTAYLIAYGTPWSKVELDAKGQLTNKHYISLCVTVDHRVVDGYEGRTLLRSFLKELYNEKTH